MLRQQAFVAGIGVIFLLAAIGASQTSRASDAYDEQIAGNARRMLEEGKQIFRFDTFGSEVFWGGKLRLHESIAGKKLDGVPDVDLNACGRGWSRQGAKQKYECPAIPGRDIIHGAWSCTRRVPQAIANQGRTL